MGKKSREERRMKAVGMEEGAGRGGKQWKERDRDKLKSSHKLTHRDVK